MCIEIYVWCIPVFGKIGSFQRRKAYLIASDLQNAITFGKV